MHLKRYTQLFFLDEAVALAAGHRPCGECRRNQYRAFIDAANVCHEQPISSASDLDQQLSASRRAGRLTSPIAALPDGVFVELESNDFRLVWRGALHKWSPEGYFGPIAVADVGVTTARLLTPTLSVEALRHGYPVVVHSSITSGVPGEAPTASIRDAPRGTTVKIGETAMAGLRPEQRSEVEQILRTSSPGLTHGEIFRYLEQGLDAQQMVPRHGTSLANIQGFMRSLRHLFDGTLPTSVSAARTNSMVYKELLNHQLSPRLLSYVKQRLRQLMVIDPGITMEPLKTRAYQYGAKRQRPVTEPAVCPSCYLAHVGECD